MQLKIFYEMQKELDNTVIKNRYGQEIVHESDHVAFLTQRLLALQVEVSELANATRCFKYWSNKQPESRERVLDEYADVMHFFLSIGNTLGFTPEEIEKAYLKKHEINYQRQLNNY